MSKVKIKKYVVCPLCDNACNEDKHDNHFHRCEKCDQNYYVAEGKIEHLPMSGVRSIRKASNIISHLKSKGLLNMNNKA